MKKAVLILAIVLSACQSASRLKCNYASADITTLEEENVFLAGFAARKGCADSVHIPLRTHCLVVMEGNKKVCIISNDLMELSPELSGKIRDSISSLTGLSKEKILIHNMHTHSSPRMGGACSEPGGNNNAYKERTVSAIINCASKTIMDKKAYRNFIIEVGKCCASIGSNRCEKGGPYDPDVYAARLVDCKGRPICAFINLACHPVCMGPESYLVSSDYSGVARRLLSKEWGCEVFQLSGAQGNIDPSYGPKDANYAEVCGKSLADSLSKIRFLRMSGNGGLQFNSGVAYLPFRISEVRIKDIKELAERLIDEYSNAFPRFVSDVKNWEAQITGKMKEEDVISSLENRMCALNIDGVILFFSQGEPFCEYQIKTRAAFPDKTIFFSGYTNGQSSYLPSERAFNIRKGYEYEIEQQFVYIKTEYPLSDKMPEAYKEAIFKTIAPVAGEPLYNIIPAPARLIPAPGFFRINYNTALVSEEKEFDEVVEDFISQIKIASRIHLKQGGKRQIIIKKDKVLAREAYRLTVKPDNIIVEASEVPGVFYALQTLFQLLPAEIYGTSAADIAWLVPCCKIEDSPRFEYRGMLLDCGRYFYPKEEVMKFIDLMAMHKQNYLHWHLTEDQGWRIEIKKYPRLTEVGAWRDETVGYGDKGDGTPHGGYYSQEDVKEIVEYARRRCVTIIPEIEIPGHSSAAIAAYPFLSCTPHEPKHVSTRWGIKEDVYCPSPETISFLEDVFKELFELFPSPYYHIGGDECPKKAWKESEYCQRRAKELGWGSTDDIQSYFVHHFDRFLRKHGKTALGWDEILERNPLQSTIVVSYRGHNPASFAIRNDTKTILAPNRWMYLDYQQQDIEDVPSNQHLFITLRKAYSYDWANFMDKELLSSKGHNIIGLQACLWGEHIPDAETLQKQTLPRKAAVAEVSWSLPERRNWNDFRMRMNKEFRRLEAKGVVYSKAFNNVIVNMDLTSDYPREVELQLDNPYASTYYTTDGAEPGWDSKRAPYVIKVYKGDTVKARGFNNEGKPTGDTMTRIF